MRRVLALIALFGVVSVGCGSPPETPPPAAPTPPVAPPAPAIAPADTSAAAPAPAKQLITVTTKSPDAKAAFLKAWDLSDNGRNEEALEQCHKAVAADADFAFGHSCVGRLSPGAAAQAELDQAAKLAAGLPDAERLTIEAEAAGRRQDTATYYADIKRVAELAPDDFHAQAWLGWALVDQRDFNAAATAFKRALDLNPAASFVHFALAFVHTQLREYDDALASAKKYADAAPDQAAAHQALGYALLNLNRPKDADVEYAKAVDLGPKSRWAYSDLATVKAIEGDFAGAREVFDKSKTAEVQPTDALDRINATAWALFAEGKSADAFKLLDATEKDADARKMPWPAYEANTRARALWVMGKTDGAIKAADAGLARCDRPEASEAYKSACRRDLLTVKAFAQLQAGKVADAQKTVATLGDEAKRAQGNNWVQVGAQLLSDEVDAIAKKDSKALLAVLDRCPPDDFLFKLNILRQAEKAGDKAGAEQVRKDVLGRPVADIPYPLVAKVTAKK